MPTAPSREILIRLTRARQFLQHARSHSAAGTEFDLMVATHSADNAVEFTLKIIADHVRYEELSGLPLGESELAKIAGDLFRFLKKEHGIQLPHYREIKTLRQVRNLVQHGAFTPGADIERLLLIAERFFVSVCKSIFDVDANQLRISQVIRDEIIRRHVLHAEQAMDDKRFEDSVRSSRNAFEEAIYKYRRRSPILTSEIPARLEITKLGPSLEWYVKRLSEELDVLRLKVDSHRMDRFHEILRHISPAMEAESGSYTVMQRPWTLNDAEFCYGFVSDNVQRWQEEEFAPLYPIAASEYRWIETINGIEIQVADSFTYDEGEHDIIVFHESRSVRDNLAALVQGSVYQRHTRRWKNDVLEFENWLMIRIRAVMSELLTHDPTRWRVVLDISNEPFTWHTRYYENGKFKSETPTLGAATARDFADLYPIDEDMALRIVSARETHGKITSETLRQIDGITEEQVWWIERFMRQ